LVEVTFRENFGFMYNHRMKGIFLIFIAFVNLGLSTNSPELEYATAAIVMIDGVGLTFATITKPEWFPEEEFIPDSRSNVAPPDEIV
jgi:hypothetical protein